MRHVNWLIATCILVLFSLVQPAAAQDKALIQKLDDEFAAAFNKGDYAAVAAMYAEDATLLPPGAPMMKGRQAIQGFWTKAGEGVTDAKLIAVDVTPLGGNAAREIGTFSLKTKGANPQELSGKFVVIWQKVGNDWKLATDIWNMDK
jgi:uncharacterized protein (TIGR02246 family)